MKLDERYTYINYLVNELEFINGKVFKYNKEIDYYDEIKNIRKYLLGILRNRGMVASKSDLDFICDSVWEYADNEKRWYDSKIVHQARKLGTLPVDTPLVFELDKKQLQLINKMLFHPEEELLIITTGVGGSGKSTFLNIVKQLFDNDCSFATLSDLSNEFMLAESIKHRIICSTELAKGEIDCRKIKQLVSKEPIMINPKHKTPEERMTQSVLFFCCNKAPKIDVTDTGILRRIIFYERNTKINNPNFALRDKVYTFDELLTIARVSLNFEGDLSEFTQETRKYIMKENSVYLYDTMSYQAYVDMCRNGGMKPYSENNWKEIKQLFDNWKIDETISIFGDSVNVHL